MEPVSVKIGCKVYVKCPVIVAHAFQIKYNKSKLLSLLLPLQCVKRYSQFQDMVHHRKHISTVQCPAGPLA